MSIIQTIRDKGARIAVFLIALALTGFILTDYFSGSSTGIFSGGSSSTVGRVNGEKIDMQDFERKISVRERSNPDNTDPRNKFVNDVWNQEVNQLLIKQECERLGITVGPKEYNDLLYGLQPSQIIQQYYQFIKQKYFGQAASQYDPAEMYQLLTQIGKENNDEEKNRMREILESVVTDRLTEKYKYLVAGSIHYPKWWIEKQNADNSLLSKLSYVVIPSAVIPDSSKELAVSDKEIKDYISKRELYKIEDERRTIAYVRFDATPSSADSAAVYKQVEVLKDTFAKSKDPLTFLMRNGSSFPYDSNFHPQSKIMVPAKDSIFKLPKDAVYGPYLDPGTTVSNYVLAKLIDVRLLPDSVKARHILVQTFNPTANQEVIPDSIGKKRIDSIELALRRGARFDSLVKLSDDKGSVAFGGVLRLTTQTGDTTDYFTQGQMVKAFNDSSFMGKVGDVKVVKTEFGYHLLEILDQKHFEINYKIAYMAKSIEASEETENTAANNAMQFAAESRDLESFQQNIEKRKLQKLLAPDLTAHAYELPGVGISREFVKAVFDADKNEVIKPQEIKDARKNTINVIAVVTEINKPGLMSIANARKTAELPLRNQKKGELIKKTIGTNITSLEAVADAMNRQYHPLDTIRIFTEDSLRFNPARGSRVSMEQKLLGAAFNTAYKGKVIPEPIIGNFGNVFVARVDNLTATTVPAVDANQQRKDMERQSRQSIIYSFFAGAGQRPFDPATILRKAAKIKDNREKLNY
jgi:peptidyl-prolyl cis-trans isomerase D